MQCVCFHAKIISKFSTWNIYVLFPATFTKCVNNAFSEQLNFFYCIPVLHIL